MFILNVVFTYLFYLFFNNFCKLVICTVTSVEHYTLIFSLQIKNGTLPKMQSKF